MPLKNMADYHRKCEMPYDQLVTESVAATLLSRPFYRPVCTQRYNVSDMKVTEYHITNYDVSCH